MTAWVCGNRERRRSRRPRAGPAVVDHGQPEAVWEGHERGFGEQRPEFSIVHVAPHCHHGIDRPQLGQDGPGADVAGMDDQIRRRQPFPAVVGEAPAAPGHVRVGDDGDVHWAGQGDIDLSGDPACDLVTGAFSYSGAGIAARLLASGRRVRTLTAHPERAARLNASVEAHPYRFDDPEALTRILEGVDTLYNTYWVKVEHAGTTFAGAVANSRTLFDAARRAGVARVVHVSVSNPALDSPLPYFRGKALVEQALAQGDLAYAIVRPTWIFGGDRELLANNIGWILRHFPVFPLPGDGRYEVQPVHIDDFARICQEAANTEGNVIVDAAGPQTLSFESLVRAIRTAVGSRSAILHVPPAVMRAASRALGVVVRDVVLTPEEIGGLMAGLLVSQDPPLGSLGFADWIAQPGGSFGRSYVNELRNHFARQG